MGKKLCIIFKLLVLEKKSDIFSLLLNGSHMIDLILYYVHVVTHFLVLLYQSLVQRLKMSFTCFQDLFFFIFQFFQQLLKPNSNVFHRSLFLLLQYPLLILYPFLPHLHFSHLVHEIHSPKV